MNILGTEWIWTDEALHFSFVLTLMEALASGDSASHGQRVLMRNGTGVKGVHHQAVRSMSLHICHLKLQVARKNFARSVQWQHFLSHVQPFLPLSAVGPHFIPGRNSNQARLQRLTCSITCTGSISIP